MGKGKASSAGPEEAGSAATRQRILDAAASVFARLPYHAASLRMIGREGDFNHEIIRYHFPSKAALFETVLSGICDGIYRANLSFLGEIAGLETGEGFSLYLDRFLDYHHRNPGALRIIVLNIAMTDDPESVPGYRHIPALLSRTRATFQEKLAVTAPDDEVARFLYGFNNLLLHLLGASYCQANILGLKHTGPKYREWVKRTMTEIFLPHMKRILGSP